MQTESIPASAVLPGDRIEHGAVGVVDVRHTITYPDGELGLVFGEGTHDLKLGPAEQVRVVDTSDEDYEEAQIRAQEADL